MHIAAIICEYNPFHNGHARQIRKVRELSGADAILLVMSGSFVQRGEPALFDMHTRCRMALMAGADVCVELPDFWSSSSAAYFAGGAISILSALNCVDSLWFGSESAGMELLDPIADILVREPEDYKIALREALKQGMSYPSARAIALAEVWEKDAMDFPWPKDRIFTEEISAVLNQPNHILGLEYCIALKREAEKHPDRKLPRPHVILRNDSGYHSETMDGSYASATAIRQSLLRGETEMVKPFVPQSCYEILQDEIRQGRYLTSGDLNPLLGAKLMTEDPLNYERYTDIDSDLANRIRNHRYSYDGFEQFTTLLKTKNITHTHIRRALLHLVLEQTEIPEEAEWIRVLGFRKQCIGIIGELSRNSKVPVILQFKQAEAALEKTAYENFSKTVRHTDLCNYLRSVRSGEPMKPEYSRRLVPI